MDARRGDFDARRGIVVPVNGKCLTVIWSPSSFLTLEEVDTLYRHDTPKRVLRTIAGITQLPVTKPSPDGRILGEYWQDDKTGEGKIAIYVQVLDDNDFLELVAAPESAARGKIRRDLLARKELHTRHHENAHEIYARYLTDEQQRLWREAYVRAVGEGWARKVSSHPGLNECEFFCDVYATYKTNPASLERIDDQSFRLMSDTYRALE